MKDIEALHPLIPADDIRSGIAFGVAHMQSIGRRVGKHIKAVEFGLVVVDFDLEGLILEPVFLPFRLDGMGIVLGHLGFLAWNLWKTGKIATSDPGRNAPMGNDAA